ncbi:MAG: isochorismatase family protein [Prevotella sp.]|jgi:nicotinamidase/pyrazinamidase
MKEKRLLLIVDPQIDFITGTLPVPGAPEAMTELAEYVKSNPEAYSHIVATSDWHPYSHCSFSSEGGPWPRHCVQHTTGAAIPDSLIEACNTTEAAFTVLYKGDRISKDEYSIMQNGCSSSRLDEIIRKEAISHIDVCGLAGDVCVLNTLKDLVKTYGKEFLTILFPYSPSLDGGATLLDYLKTNDIAKL